MAAFDLATLIPNMLLGLGVEAVETLENWTVADLYDYANQDLDRLHGNYTLFVDGVDDIAVVAGQANYEYPARRVGTLLVALDGKMLVPASVGEIEARTDNFEGVTGDTPTRFIEDFLGESVFRLDPTPVATGTVTMLYLDNPTDLSETQTLVDVPTPIGDIFTLRVIAEARRQETDASMPEVVQACEQLLKIYDGALAAYWGGGL